MAVAELTLVPIGTKKTSVSGYIAKASNILERQDKVKYYLNPMGTVLEGNIDDIFNIIRQMQEEVFNEDVNRLYSVIKIDDRRDKDYTCEDKVQSVIDKLEK